MYPSLEEICLPVLAWDFFFFSRSAKTVTDGHLLSRFLLFPFSFFIPICLKNRTKTLFFIILVEFHGGVEVHEYF